jgi:hypothetical protein
MNSTRFSVREIYNAKWTELVNEPKLSVAQREAEHILLKTGWRIIGKTLDYPKDFRQSKIHVAKQYAARNYLVMYRGFTVLGGLDSTLPIKE